MKKSKLIFLFGIFLIIIVLVFSVYVKDKIPSNIFSFLDIGTYRVPPKAVEVNAFKNYGQTFVSNFDNLFMMSVFIPTQKLDRDGELFFHLRRGNGNDKDLVTLKWDYNQIRFAEKNFYVIPPDRESVKEGFHFHFQFPPIRDSKNEEFYFYFDSPNVKENEGIELGFWDDIDCYEALTKGMMHINHKPTKGFLAFRTYNAWDGSASLLINEIRFRLLKDKAFLIFYIGILLIVLLAMMIASIKTKNI